MKLLQSEARRRDHHHDTSSRSRQHSARFFATCFAVVTGAVGFSPEVTLAAAAGAQTKSKPAPTLVLPKRAVGHVEAPITIDFDKESGLVTVKSFPMISDGRTMVATFRTKSDRSQLLRPSDPVTIHVEAPQAAAAKYSVDRPPLVTFEIDGKQASVKKADWSMTEYRNGEVQETFDIELSASTFVRLVKANVAFIRIGDEQIKLGPEALRTMIELAARIDKKLLLETAEIRWGFNLAKGASELAQSPDEKRLMQGALMMAQVEQGFTQEADIVRLMRRESDRTTTLSSGDRKLIYDEEGMVFVIGKDGRVKDLTYYTEPIP